MMSVAVDSVDISAPLMVTQDEHAEAPARVSPSRWATLLIAEDRLNKLEQSKDEAIANDNYE